MYRRPWPVVVLAALHILAPFINVMIQSLIFGISPIEFLKGLRGAGFFDIYRFYLLMPIAGVAIYAMKRWSYPVFFGSWIWCIAGNYLSLKETLALPNGSSPLPAGREAFSMALNLGLISYFILPRVRAAYFRPNARWWEPEPRYALDNVAVDARVDERSYDGAIENLSLSGMKLKLADSSLGALTSGECLQLAFEMFNEKYRFNGQIMRVDSSGALGIQLLHTAKSRSELKHLIKRLNSNPSTKCSRSGSLSDTFRDFLGWVKSLKEHPDGLLPQMPNQPMKNESAPKEKA
jgi:hypothetical protein